MIVSLSSCDCPDSEGPSLKKIADLIDCVIQTVKNQVDKYVNDSLSAIIKEIRVGKYPSYLTVEQDLTFFKNLLDS